MEEQYKQQMELRVALLGWERSENNLVGNAILGHEAFDRERDTDTCVCRQGTDLARAQLTVVSTPQSWLDYVVDDPAFLEHSIATLCRPGLHILLLVIPVGSLPMKEWTLEAALVLLCDILWRHTMVVFTAAEKLTESRIETVAKEYGCLQSALEKCGHRYCCLNTSQRPQDSANEIQELLKKMMAMAEMLQTETSVNALCADSMLQEAERRTIIDNERAKLRLAEVQKRYQTHKLLQAGSPNPVRNLRAVMLGARKAGKSTVGNIIFGHEVFQSGQPTQCCVEESGEVVGKNLTLVDTPGWHRRCCSTLTPAQFTNQIASSSISELENTESDVFLLVVCCNETFTEMDKRLLQEHASRWGSRDVWQRSIVLFTWGDRLRGTPVEQHIQRWPALVWLVERCGNRYHMLDNVARTCSCKVKELVEEIEEVSLINNSRHLLQMLLQSRRDKKKLRSKVKELEKTVKDLQRDYNQLERLQEERNQSLQETLHTHEEREKRTGEMQQSLQETLQSYKERESLMAENQHLLAQKLTDSEMKRMKLRDELDQFSQRCHKQDRLIDQMRREQLTPREAIVYQEQELRNPTLGQSDENNTLESVTSGMNGGLLHNRNQWEIPSKDLQSKRHSEIGNLALSERKRGPDHEQTDIRADGMKRREKDHWTEPAFVYVELDCSMPQQDEPPTQPVTQHQPQQQEVKPVARSNWLEGLAAGAVIGSLKGLQKGPRAAVLDTAMGATLGALLHILYLRTKGKR